MERTPQKGTFDIVFNYAPICELDGNYASSTLSRRSNEKWITVNCQSINALKQFENASPEEIRFMDYQLRENSLSGRGIRLQDNSNYILPSSIGHITLKDHQQSNNNSFFQNSKFY